MITQNCVDEEDLKSVAYSSRGRPDLVVQWEGRGMPALLG